jgi:hypothetical protein
LNAVDIDTDTVLVRTLLHAVRSDLDVPNEGSQCSECTVVMFQNMMTS